MIPFHKYIQIKNNYCIVYIGPEKLHVDDLVNILPILDEYYPDIITYICCRDELISKYVCNERILPLSKLELNKKNFAYIRNLSCNDKTTPAEVLLQECFKDNG